MLIKLKEKEFKFTHDGENKYQILSLRFDIIYFDSHFFEFVNQ